MSRKNVPRISTGAREDKFQQDLQQHSRRMGWGMPGKHKPKQQRLPPPGGSGSKGKGKGRGRKMPILHRAGSGGNVGKGVGLSGNLGNVHPNHGTLDESAKAKTMTEGEGGGGGKPWWEAEFDGGGEGGGRMGGTEPLPPTLTSKGDIKGKGSSQADDILGVTIGFVGNGGEEGEVEEGAVVAFNPHEPLPGIPTSEDDDKFNEPGDEYSDEVYEDDTLASDSGDVSAQTGTTSDQPTVLNDPDLADPSLAMKMVASNDPSTSPTPLLGPPTTSQAASDSSMADFKLSQMVDAALFASWKALPWQTRVCPMALEERESVRLLASMVSEAR